VKIRERAEITDLRELEGARSVEHAELVRLTFGPNPAPLEVNRRESTRARWGSA
jgi:hypothetical protein